MTIPKAALKLQIILAVLMVVLLAASLYAQTITPVGTISTSWWDRLLEPQNVIAIMLVVFHLGGLRSQFGDMRKRVAELERWRLHDLDGIYARQKSIDIQFGRRRNDFDADAR